MSRTKAKKRLQVRFRWAGYCMRHGGVANTLRWTPLAKRALQRARARAAELQRYVDE